MAIIYLKISLPPILKIFFNNFNNSRLAVFSCTLKMPFCCSLVSIVSAERLAFSLIVGTLMCLLLLAAFRIFSFSLILMHPGVVFFAFILIWVPLSFLSLQRMYLINLGEILCHYVWIFLLPLSSLLSWASNYMYYALVLSFLVFSLLYFSFDLGLYSALAILTSFMLRLC